MKRDLTDEELLDTFRSIWPYTTLGIKRADEQWPAGASYMPTAGDIRILLNAYLKAAGREGWPWQRTGTSKIALLRKAASDLVNAWNRSGLGYSDEVAQVCAQLKGTTWAGTALPALPAIQVASACGPINPLLLKALSGPPHLQRMAANVLSALRGPDAPQGHEAQEWKRKYTDPIRGWVYSERAKQTDFPGTFLGMDIEAAKATTEEWFTLLHDLRRESKACESHWSSHIIMAIQGIIDIEGVFSSRE